MDQHVYHLRKLAKGSQSKEFVHIQNWMTDPRLTPFLGAAVSANPLNGSQSFKFIFDALHAEIQTIRGQFAESDPAHIFLNIFTARYIGCRQPLTYHPPTTEQNLTDHVCAAALRNFRTSLVRLIVDQSIHFNQTASQQPTFYFSKQPKQISLQNSTKTISIKKMMKALQDANNELKIAPGAAQFQKDIFSQMWERLNSRYDMDSGTKRNPALDIEHLTWLSDLLWLSLIIWWPLYPDSHELGVELAVVSDAQHTASWETRPARTAETFSASEKLNTHIAGRFEALDPSRSDARDDKINPRDCLIMDTHVTVAAKALQMAKSESSYRPIILTTNFDRGLESAIEDLIKASGTNFSANGYRVAYPVLVRRRSPEDQPAEPQNDYRLVWVARDWRADRKDQYRWIETGGNSDPLEVLELNKLGLSEKEREKTILHHEQLHRKSRGTSDDDNVDGPIIVKMHGSPLDCAEPLSDGTLDYHPYLVLSEYQYLVPGI